MSIEFECRCGKSTRIDHNRTDKTSICSDCGAPLDISETSELLPTLTSTGIIVPQLRAHSDQPSNEITGDSETLASGFSSYSDLQNTATLSSSFDQINNHFQNDKFELDYDPLNSDQDSDKNDSYTCSTHAERILKADPFYRIARAKKIKREHIDTGKGGFAYGIHRILRPHVKGGMGQVHIAYDQFLKREVALKELFSESTIDEAIVHRFIVEAEITAQLEHPGIVPIHSLGLDTNGNPYYTMKLIRGRTLQETIKQYFRHPTEAELKRLVRRFVSVCQTMSFVHKKGVIHRDLKPANIMLSDHGETLVMDWGIAKSYLKDHPSIAVSPSESGMIQSQDRPELTIAGTVVGTPAFMSPEQASPDSPDVGPVSDIFSLGAILFYMLTGRNAYTGRSSQEVLTKLLTTKPPRPSEVARNIPPGLEAICLKAMSRKIKDRYQTAEDLAADLCNWLDGEPISALRETFMERTGRFFRKHRQFSVGIFIFFMLSVFCLVFLLLILDRSNQKTRLMDTQISAVSGRIQIIDTEISGLEKQAIEKHANASSLFKEAAAETLKDVQAGRQIQAEKELAEATALEAKISELRRARLELTTLKNTFQRLEE